MRGLSLALKFRREVGPIIRGRRADESDAIARVMAPSPDRLEAARQPSSVRSLIRECQDFVSVGFHGFLNPRGSSTMREIRPELLDELLSGYEKPSDLLGEDGIFRALKKRLLEHTLSAGLSEHLGYEKGERSGRRGVGFDPDHQLRAGPRRMRISRGGDRAVPNGDRTRRVRGGGLGGHGRRIMNHLPVRLDVTDPRVDRCAHHAAPRCSHAAVARGGTDHDGGHRSHVAAGHGMAAAWLGHGRRGSPTVGRTRPVSR
jgi:hypothetical protein